MTGRVMFRFAALVLVIAGVAGCAGGERTTAVTGVAERFSAAIDASDLSAACGLLAPATREELETSAGKPCSTALAEEDLGPLGSVTNVQVYGLQARVRGTEDTLFLADLGRHGGWRVIAAGCQPQPGQPYECTVKGD